MTMALQLTGRNERGEIETVCFATEGFTTEDDDSPSNVTMEGRLLKAGSFERHLAGRGKTRGTSAVGFGPIEIDNSDGSQDRLIDWSFEGFEQSIYVGEVGAPYPRGWKRYLTVVLDGVPDANRAKIVFPLRTVQALVARKLVVTQTLAGVGVLEGDAATAGESKNQTYGLSRNVSLTCVDRNDLIYLAAWRAVQAIDVTALADKGALLTTDAPYSSLADLILAGPSPAHAKAYLGSESDSAYVRLGSRPQGGTVTADILEGNDSAGRSAAQIALRILTGPGGLSAVRVEGVRSLDGKNNAVVGIATGAQQVEIGPALDAILGSVSGYWIDTRLGAIRLGRLSLPQAVPVAEFDEWQLLNETPRIIANEDGGVPVYSVTVEYDRNYTVQTPDQLAGTASFADQEYRRKEYRTVVAEDRSILARNAGALPIVVTTQLSNAIDAQAEANRLLLIYGTLRRVYEIDIDPKFAAEVELGDTVRLTASRYSLLAGMLVLVIGEIFDIETNITTLILWG